MHAGSHSGVDNGQGLVIWKPDVSCLGYGVVRNSTEIIVGNREICSRFRNACIGVSEYISIVTMLLACEKAVRISQSDATRSVQFLVSKGRAGGWWVVGRWPFGWAQRKTGSLGGLGKTYFHLRWQQPSQV